MGIGSSLNANPGNKHRSRMENMDPQERRELTRTLHTSFMEMDADGNVILKTPQAATMAATVYLAAHPPPEGAQRGPCTSLRLPDSDSSEPRSTRKLPRSRRRKLRSG